MQAGNQEEYFSPESYLFLEKGNQTKKEGHRSIFDGFTEFEENEKKYIQQFKAYAAKHNYELKKMWTDGMILRFLQASSFKMEKTLSSIKSYTIYRETKLPIKVDEALAKLIDSGILYLHGRDNHFRPIVIFNFNQIDPQIIDVELMGIALTYWMEYIVDEWMLPGQVENWIFVSNVKGLKLANLAMGSMRKMFTYLQDNFKCRLYKMYIIGATNAMIIPWNIIKRFLDGDTVNKVEFFKTQVPEDLFKHTNREQVEQKFGGTAPNSNTYWPPKVPSNNYFVSEEDKKNLMSEDEYINLYKNESLKDMRVSPFILKKLTIPNIVESETPNPCNDVKDVCANDENVKESHETLTSPQKTLEYTEENFTEEGIDFIDYMNEENHFDKREIRMKEFETSFLQKIRSSYAKSNLLKN